MDNPANDNDETWTSLHLQVALILNRLRNHARCQEYDEQRNTNRGEQGGERNSAKQRADSKQHGQLANHPTAA